MIKYAFKNRTDAEALLALLPTANRPNSQRVRFGPRLTTGWLFFTPPGGIPAAGEELCGEAECTPYFIDENFNKKEILDDGESFTVTVLNVFSTAVGGDRFVTAKEIYGRYVVDAEDCGIDDAPATAEESPGETVGATGTTATTTDTTVTPPPIVPPPPPPPEEPEVEEPLLPPADPDKYNSDADPGTGGLVF